MDNAVLLTVNELSRFDAYITAGRGLEHADALRLFLAYRSAAASLILEQQRLCAIEVSRDMAVKRHQTFTRSLDVLERNLPTFASNAYHECAKGLVIDHEFKTHFITALTTITQAVVTVLRDANTWSDERRSR